LIIEIKTDAKPVDIPLAPHISYKKEWTEWGDFLGTGFVATKYREYRSFESARQYVRSLGFSTEDELKKWLKSSERPLDIPLAPRATYKKEWINAGDFIGTGNISNREREYRSFEKAREFVSKIGLKSGKEWIAWAKTDERPDDIPASPRNIYKASWKGMPYFLNSGVIPTHGRQWRSFEEAKKFAQSLALEGNLEWRKWSKTDARPFDIPAYPNEVYEEVWTSWGDFLGTGAISVLDRTYRSFDDAKDFVRSLKLKTHLEWIEWAKTSHIPNDIPAAPEGVYGNLWRGWGDWLGFIGKWNKKALLAFVESLIPMLSQLEPIELLHLMKKNGIIDASKNKFSGTSRLLKEVITLSHAKNPENAAQAIADRLASHLGVSEEKLNVDQEAKQEEYTEKSADYLAENELPSLKIVDVLRNLDCLQSNLQDPDEHSAEFLSSKAVAKMWKYILTLSEGEPNWIHAQIEEAKNYKGNTYSEIAKIRFISQYHSATMLEIPQGYSFKKNDLIKFPNLMQRLVAARIKEERALGNWSGTGAGKTLAAILASRVIKAKLTVIVTVNSTLDGWQAEIKNAFPDSQVFLKKIPQNLRTLSSHAYLVLNYEAFQQKESQEHVQWLLDKHKIDFVILDEIHNVKRRGQLETRRRNLLRYLLSIERQRNCKLCVLGMSATPVINSLDEAISLLSMLKGDHFQDLKTHPTFDNCLPIHERLIMHGVRYLPKYPIKLDLSLLSVDGNDLIEELEPLKASDVVKIERILLKAKLPSILNNIKPGTLIYTKFVEGIVDDIQTYLKEQGFSVAKHTGAEKEGLQRFLDKEVDVLIGSSTIGTGIDGLQYACNQLIILSLPWTNAEYMQLLGRIHRQGSVFDKIQVLIPQVVLRQKDGLEWSWDQQRWGKIRDKKTLGDAVLDGIFPEEKISSHQSMLEQSLKALHSWIERLNKVPT
jgi:superfamily II DNA or RNA helicase